MDEKNFSCQRQLIFMILQDLALYTYKKMTIVQDADYLSRSGKTNGSLVVIFFLLNSTAISFYESIILDFAYEFSNA